MKGFTLLELMVVLSIVLIALLIALPSQSDLYQRSQDEAFSTQLLQALGLARDEAVTQNKTVTLCGSRDGKGCSDDWTAGYIILHGQQRAHVFQTFNTKGDLYWRAFPGHKKDLTFLSSGATDNENGTFWYCRKNATSAVWAIFVGQSGRGRLWLADGNQKAPEGLSCRG